MSCTKLAIGLGVYNDHFGNRIPITHRGHSGSSGELNVCMSVLAGLPICSADIVPVGA